VVVKEIKWFFLNMSFTHAYLRPCKKYRKTANGTKNDPNMFGPNDSIRILVFLPHMLFLAHLSILR